MNKFFPLLTLSLMPLAASAQADGITLDLESQSPLSKWGRWTYIDHESKNYAVSLSQNRNKIPFEARWSQGDWIFKLNKDMLSKRHDLFFGLKISEANAGTTSIGCMSNSGKNGSGSALCGVQLDLHIP